MELFRNAHQSRSVSGGAEMAFAPLVYGSGDDSKFRGRISLHALINLGAYKQADTPTKSTDASGS
jgi:hypothetical protein